MLKGGLYYEFVQIQFILHIMGSTEFGEDWTETVAAIVLTDPQTSFYTCNRYIDTNLSSILDSGELKKVMLGPMVKICHEIHGNNSSQSSMQVCEEVKRLSNLSCYNILGDYLGLFRYYTTSLG